MSRRLLISTAAAVLAVLAAVSLGLFTPDESSGAPGGPVPASLIASCRTETAAPGFKYRFCDDGIPTRGGTLANESGARAVRVPAAYRGYRALPPMSKGARRVPGADSRGFLSLDVDVSYPVTAPGPLPLIVLMHGCCASTKNNWEAQTTPQGERFDAPGEKWHFNNAWFAARGYVVINYTARGFREFGTNGSTGQTHIGSRSHEINDFQAIACAITGVFNRNPALPDIAPRRVVTSGGSYGGTFAWMTATDPLWRCRGYTGAGGTRMRLAAAANRYGWTDLAYALAPTGTHLSSPRRLPAANGCDSLPWKLNGRRCANGPRTVGIPKTSMNKVLYRLGIAGFGPGRTTFPAATTRMWKCLQGPFPPRRPCARNLRRTLTTLQRESSPYYQNRWFRLIRKRAAYRVPIFDAGTLTDPLFSAIEEIRMLNRIRRAYPRYPIQAYFGDYHHFNNNKDLVWADTCRGGRICRQADYRNKRRPIRIGVTTRLNRFIDHYARPPLAARRGRPRFTVTTEIQVCPQNARSLGVPFSRGGRQLQARTFQGLSRRALRLRLRGRGTTQSLVRVNPHATGGDPVRSDGARCNVERGRAGRGVATFQTGRLKRARTLVGLPLVHARFRARGNPRGAQLDARLYDVFPSGASVLVDRGMRILSRREFARGAVAFELFGNVWRFPRGHRIRVELTQDDSPFLQHSSTRSRMRIRGVNLTLPIR